MAKSLHTNNNRKLMSVREVQDEYINMDIRKLRTFLNTYLQYRKIGHLYYYQRSEVEELLTAKDGSYEFDINPY